jgi:DNA-binding transcriptional ArsR family regulator
MPRKAPADATRSSSTFPSVRVVSGAAFEVIAELAAFTSGPARASLESGKAWIREVRRLAGADLIERVEGYALGLYVELATVALEAPAPRGAEDLTAALEAIDADALKRRLLSAESPLNRTMVSDGAIERAIAGDAEARTEVRSAFGLDRTARQAIDRVLELRSDAVKSELMAIVRDWADRVFPRFATDALAAVERDRIAKDEQLATMPGQAVLTAATNGVSFNPSPWVAEIAIVPTVALRPFLVPTELRETSIFVCSVADEALDVDPTAPPRRLVKAAAALGDELRLRVLHMLRDEDLNASEIAERLGVERTSLHHHLGILRSAGLLTIRDEGERGWRFALREDGLRGLGPELESYLGPHTPRRSSS